MAIVRGRRHPRPKPRLNTLGEVGRAREQDRFNMDLIEGFSGLPAPHAETHLLDDPRDPLPAPGQPTTVRVNQPAVAGDGPALAAEDHVHDLDLGLTTKGDLIVYNGAVYQRLGTGAAATGSVLTKDPGAPAGLAWSPPATAAPSSSVGPSAQEIADLELRASFDSLALRELIARNFR